MSIHYAHLLTMTRSSGITPLNQSLHAHGHWDVCFPCLVNLCFPDPPSGISFIHKDPEDTGVLVAQTHESREYVLHMDLCDSRLHSHNGISRWSLRQAKTSHVFLPEVMAYC
jgi:hypothetical protein